MKMIIWSVFAFPYQMEIKKWKNNLLKIVKAKWNMIIIKNKILMLIKSKENPEELENLKLSKNGRRRLSNFFLYIKLLVMQILKMEIKGNNVWYAKCNNILTIIIMIINYLVEFLNINLNEKWKKRAKMIHRKFHSLW